MNTNLDQYVLALVEQEQEVTTSFNVTQAVNLMVREMIDYSEILLSDAANTADKLTILFNTEPSR